MNQQQKNYIKRRITDTLNQKMNDLRISMTKPHKMLTNEQRINLIRANKVKLKSKKELLQLGNYNINLGNAWDFSKYESRGGYDQKEYQKKCNILRNKANEITDQIMIGDSEQALKMIRDFEAFMP